MENLNISCQTIYYIVLAAAALVGGIFSLFQWQKQLNLRKAEFLEKMMNSLLNDKDIVEVVYRVEYGPNWYKDEEGNDIFHKTDFEKKMDKTITRYSYYAYLYENKLIKEDEFNFVKYTIERLLNSKQTKEYFNDLIIFCQSQNVFFPHNSLLNYGKKVGIFAKDF